MVVRRYQGSGQLHHPLLRADYTLKKQKIPARDNEEPRFYRIKATSQPTRAAGIKAKIMPGNSIPLAWNHF